MARTNKSRIQTLLSDFGRGLSEGDGKALADLFALPAYVIGDDMAMPLTERKQVEQLFGAGKEQYARMGIVEARPEIQQIEPLTAKLFSVDVKWPYVYEDGHETAGEASRYLVQLDDDAVRFRSVTMLGVQAS
jgi:hypothetical protein